MNQAWPPILYVMLAIIVYRRVKIRSTSSSWNHCEERGGRSMIDVEAWVIQSRSTSKQSRILYLLTPEAELKRAIYICHQLEAVSFMSSGLAIRKSQERSVFKVQRRIRERYNKTPTYTEPTKPMRHSSNPPIVHAFITWIHPMCSRPRRHWLEVPRRTRVRLALAAQGLRCCLFCRIKVGIMIL